MNKKNIVAKCVVYSIAFHLIILEAAVLIKLPGMDLMIDRTKHFFNIKTVKKDLAPKQTFKKMGITYANRVLRFEKPGATDFVRQAIDKEEPPKNKIGAESSAPQYDDNLSHIGGLEETLSEIQPKALVPEMEKRYAQKDMVGINVNSKEGMASPGEILPEETFSEDFSEKMPGITPEKKGAIESIKDKIKARFAKDNATVIKKSGSFGSLDQYLTCELSVYTDPDDGEKYYKLAIRAGRDADKLAVAQKEMIFLMDSSLSIQPERLNEFRKGLEYCLEHLNKDDLFNVVVFKEKARFFRPESVKADEDSIKDAMRFVRALSASQVTDCYNALNETINMPAMLAPCYIVLFSDGKPTYGITSSRKIINEITDKNAGKRPIFAFSGGARVNRYLLDFIAYKNRGWAEYAGRAYLVGGHIASMYNKIKDPLLVNLRYRVSNVEYKDIFPKSLPDFFKNAEFTLYGKYKEETTFSLQLLGDIKNETNEFIVIAPLKDAIAGNQDIARNWAFNKIYYLIGLLQDGKDNTRIFNEIRALCEKFDIKTPYSEGLKD